MSFYFRRCHNCASINVEENQVVDICSQCHIELTPFVFFDDLSNPDREYPAQGVLLIEFPGEDKQFAPLVGLSVFW